MPTCPLQNSAEDSGLSRCFRHNSVVGLRILSAAGSGSPLANCLLGGTENSLNFFLFSRCSPFVEDRPGGTYLSGQSSNPVSRRCIRIDPSVRVGRSFSEFRTCCVGQSCASSIRESRCTKECTALGETRDLGGQS